MDECDFCGKEIPFMRDGTCETCGAEERVTLVSINLDSINEDRRMRAMAFGSRVLNDD